MHPRSILQAGALGALGLLGNVAALQYQEGNYEVDTISVAGLVTNSATVYTVSSSQVQVTTTFPIWACTACPPNYNAIVVSPKSLWGASGVPSPPPHYQALTVGADFVPTPVGTPPPSTPTDSPASYYFANSTARGYPATSAAAGPPSSSTHYGGTAPGSTHSQSSAGSPASESSGSHPAPPSSRSVGGTGPGNGGASSTVSPPYPISSSTHYGGTAPGSTHSQSSAGSLASESSGSHPAPPSSRSVGGTGPGNGGASSTVSPPYPISSSTHSGSVPVGTGASSHVTSGTGAHPPTSSGILGTGHSGSGTQSGAESTNSGGSGTQSGSNTASGSHTGTASGGSHSGSGTNTASGSQTGTASGSGSHTASGASGSNTQSASNSGSQSGTNSGSNTNTGTATGTGTGTGAGASSTVTSAPGVQVTTVPTVVSGSTHEVSVTVTNQATSPAITATPSIDPAGSQASSSVGALSTNLVGIVPILQGWIDNQGDNEKDTAISALKKSTPLADDLLNDLGGSSSSGGCNGKRKVKRSLLSSLLNTVSCITSTLGDITDDINKGTEDAINDVTSKLSDVKDLTSELEKEQEEQDSSQSNSDHQSTQDQSSGSKASSEASTTQSSSASCTASVTASDCRVVCGAANSATSKSCSTTCYSTFAGCSATGITTTSVASSSGYELCGQSCAACAAEDTSFPVSNPCADCTGDPPLLPDITTAVSDASATAVVKRVMRRDVSKPGIEKRRLPGPEDYNNDQTSFVLGELNSAFLVPHRQTGGTSSALVRPFGNQGFNMGVTRLYGCTSVIIVSREGAWISHLWELPSFGTQADFQTQILDQIRNGDGTDVMPGVAGYCQPNAVFSKTYFPATIIVTPRPRGSDVSGHYLYPDKVGMLQRLLKDLVPSAEPLIIDYKPLSGGDDIDHLTTAKGKVMLQYDPAHEYLTSPNIPCTIQQARFRVWVEDQPRYVLQKYWPADDHQLRPQPQQGGNQKRDGGVCSIGGTQPLSLSETAASTGAASSGGSATSGGTNSASATGTASTDSGASTTSGGDSNSGGSGGPTTSGADHSTATSEAPSSTSAAASSDTNPLWCAPTSGPDVPKGIPSYPFTLNITGFCTGDLALFGSSIGCDDKTHDGFYLSRECDLQVTDDSLQYYFDDTIAYLNVSLAPGSPPFTVDKDQCNTYLHEVLNGCPPFHADSGQDLIKYGGGVAVEDNGATAFFNITLESSPGTTASKKKRDTLLQRWLE